jgi:hypothetical protein
MKKIYVSIAFLVLSVLPAAVSAQSEAAGYHVTICHRTGSATNPYIVISPDVEGVVNGHLDHEQTGNGLGGDIVPVFVFHGVTYSKNLGIDIGGFSGAAILANGCRVPTRGPTPTPTVRPPGTPPPPEPVPEPMTLVLFGIGLAGIGFAARRQLFR